MRRDLLHKDLAKVIINCFYTVYNTLGYGFLEKVYENALAIELRERGLKAQQQYPIKVFYKRAVVGNYYADIVVEDKVLLELKAEESIAPKHKVQIQNYLKASQLELGLIFNFGPQPSFKRRVFQNIPPQKLDKPR